MKLFAFLSSPTVFVLIVISTIIHAQNTPASNNFNYISSTPSQHLYINATQAQTVISAAANKAFSVNPSHIAVTDPSSLLVAFLRGDNAYPASIDISIKKARTASLFNGQFRTADLYNASLPSGGLYGIEETNGGLVVVGGGGCRSILEDVSLVSWACLEGLWIRTSLWQTAGVQAIDSIKPS